MSDTAITPAGRSAAPSPQPAGAPLTIAVVSWNTRELLGQCLASLERDAAAGLADVWVVDNASSDGSAELVEQGFPWVTLVRSEDNLGFGAAVNLVARRTSSEWLAPANADIRVREGTLRRLLEEGRGHPHAGVIAPGLVLPDGRPQHSVYPFPTLAFTLAYVSGALRLSRRLARRWCIGAGFDPTVRREVPWAVGAFLLVRRSAFNQVGGFDQRQWMYAEDLDLGWRLRRAGWAARYEPEAPVDHAESAATGKAWGDARHARWHASTYAWLVRRRGALFAHLIAAIYVGGFLARAALLWAPALAGSAGARDRRTFALDTARAHAVGLRPASTLLRVA